MTNLVIYTDGAYSSKRDQGGIGIVALLNGEIVQKFSHPYKNTTNNKMEVLAVITALNAVKAPIDKLTIYTDSMYVIGCATKGWKRKKNLKLWELYDTIMNKISEFVTDIEFIHVKGHADNEYNNLCDKLAVEASQELI